MKVFYFENNFGDRIGYGLMYIFIGREVFVVKGRLEIRWEERL